jgi:hypothetical protein
MVASEETETDAGRSTIERRAFKYSQVNVLTGISRVPAVILLGSSIGGNISPVYRRFDSVRL